MRDAPGASRIFSPMQMRLSGVKCDDSVRGSSEFVQTELMFAPVSSERKKTTAAFSCKQGENRGGSPGP